MARIAIVTDSSADLTPEMRAGGRITVVPVPVAAVPGRAAAPRDSEGLLDRPRPALVDTFAATFTELGGHWVRNQLGKETTSEARLHSQS